MFITITIRLTCISVEMCKKKISDEHIVKVLDITHHIGLFLQ